MSLTTQQLGTALYAEGIPAHFWRWKDAAYDGLKPEWVREAWGYWVASLPPQLTEMMQIGGGKTEKRPLWRPDFYDCDNHCLSFTSFVVDCCAVDCIATGRARGGTALGPFDYTADSARRKGRHAAIWFADRECGIHFFEPADGVAITLTPEERASVTEGFAA